MIVATVPSWVALVGGLGFFLIGVGVGAVLAWEDQAWRRRNRPQGEFISPGMSRERLGLEDSMREGRGTTPLRMRPEGNRLEGPVEFR